VSVNGVVAGEAGINALVASAYQVPIVLVTGDETTAEETRRLCPAIRAAVVKKSVTRFAAESLHPSVAQDLIREQAKLALDELSTAAAPMIERPVQLAISFRTSDYCELASRVSGVERTGPLTARMVAEEPLEIYQQFVTVVLLCRGLVE
jgi:D-amino peptidase